MRGSGFWGQELRDLPRAFLPCPAPRACDRSLARWRDGQPPVWRGAFLERRRAFVGAGARFLVCCTGGSKVGTHQNGFSTVETCKTSLDRLLRSKARHATWSSLAKSTATGSNLRCKCKSFHQLKTMCYFPLLVFKTLHSDLTFAESNICFILPVGFEGNRFHYWRSVFIFPGGLSKWREALRGGKLESVHCLDCYWVGPLNFTFWH